MSRNFDRAVEIKNRIEFYEDQAIANDDDLEMAMFAAILDALAAEELDEEEEVTLTPAYDMDSEFNEFSTPADEEYGESQLGTFVGHPADDPNVGTCQWPADSPQPYTSHITRLRQAAENGGVRAESRFNSGKIIGEAFSPCGAD